MQGENDYHALPATTPAWIGNLPTSHISTFTEANAGRVGIAGVRWLEWLLRGNLTSATFFTANGSSTDGWSVESKDLASIKVTPIS
jgi:hypothetical protein